MRLLLTRSRKVRERRLARPRLRMVSPSLTETVRCASSLNKGGNAEIVHPSVDVEARLREIVVHLAAVEELVRYPLDELPKFDIFLVLEKKKYVALSQGVLASWVLSFYWYSILFDFLLCIIIQLLRSIFLSFDLPTPPFFFLPKVICLYLFIDAYSFFFVFVFYYL